VKLKLIFCQSILQKKKMNAVVYFIKINFL
jgi:hypothetical protein